jgi:hypothetical protein
MSASSERVVEEKVPWIPLILVTVISSIVVPIAWSLMGPSGGYFQCTYNLAIISRSIVFTMLPYLLIMLTFPFQRILKLSGSALTYLYTVGIIVCYAVGQAESSLFPAQFSGYLILSTEVADVLGTWWWIPSQDVVKAMMSGPWPAAINWAAWAPAIFFWFLFEYTLFLFATSLTLIFRRRWIEIEMLPFPIVLTAHELIRRIEYSPKKAKLASKPFYIGLILGLVFGVPIALIRIFPWFPDIYGWRVNTCPSNVWSVPRENIVAQTIVHFAMVSKDPIAFGLFFLAPLSVTFNVWFWTIVEMILDQVAYYMGYYTGVFETGCGCRMSHYLNIEPPFMWSYMGGVGGATALTIMYLFHSRSYLKETLKAAISGKQPVEGEPVSYRLSYILAIVGAIAILAFLMSAGISFIAALAMFLTICFINVLADTYIYCNTSFLAVNNLRGGWEFWALNLTWPELPKREDTNWLMSHWLSEVMANGGVIIQNPLSTIMPLKMAKLTGTSSRNVFLVAFICMPISILTILVTRTWVVNYYGLGRLDGWTGLWCSITESCGGGIGYSARLPSASQYGVASLVGFIITVVLSLLHARFIWFPLEPLGFIMATTTAGMYYGIWSACLVAWAVKFIVLKVGGSRLYMDYGIPTIGGFVTGYVIAAFLGVILSVTKFFIPF